MSFIKPPQKIHLDASFYQMPGWIYFITIATNFKTSYFVKEDLNKEIIECLKRGKERLKCKVYVYCLMPDHLHILCGTNENHISVLDFVNQFKGKSTRIGWKYEIKGPLWQKRNYDHILRKEENLQEIADYIVNNPVRGGLVERWNQYPFCGYLDNFNL